MVILMKGYSLKIINPTGDSMKNLLVMSFAQLVKYGLNEGSNIVDGMPWSFEVNDIAFSHENDESYIVANNVDSGMINSNESIIILDGGCFEIVKTDSLKGIFDEIKSFGVLHKKVKLKSGLEGSVIGLYQDRKDLPFNYLVEYWTKDGKQKDWYYIEDFDFI